MDARIISAIISGLIAILAPVVLHYLSKSGNNKELEKINYQIKRMELVEKMKAINSKSNKETDSFINAELKNAEGVLQASNTNLKKLLKKYDGLPEWRKKLLLFKPRSLKVAIMQFIFFYLLYGILSVLLVNIDINVMTQNDDISYDEAKLVMNSIKITLVTILIFVVYWIRKKTILFQKGES